MKQELFDFGALVTVIRQVHEQCALQASKAVNVSLTLRNWVIGLYIERYERMGADRAKYGDRLMEALAKKLSRYHLPRCDRRELYRYRKFYLTYPQILESVTPQLLAMPYSSSRRKALTRHSLNKDSSIVESLTPQSGIPGGRLVERLSFTHFAELLEIEDPLKRSFYEIESIRDSWSVRTLKRQIASLYYERSGLSKNKKKLKALTRINSKQTESNLIIRDPYVFEFLGVKSKEVMSESDLEDALLDKLHDFLIELGHGFCFEARQKQIIIGNTRGYIDLVFYHRVLKCHVLLELKVDEFKHEHLGQLNTYVSWYRKNMMAKGDNPPIGLLLCTKNDRTLVEYALAGMDNNLFVSRYQFELPKVKAVQRFLKEQLRSLG